MDDTSGSSGTPAGAADAFELHCLADQRPPAEMIEDARQLAALPPTAVTRLWDVLGPTLADPLPKDAEARLRAFADAHGITGVDVGGALRVARTLVRQASALDLQPEQLAEDLGRLFQGRVDLRDVFLRGFARARARVRTEIARRSIADHGKVLERIHWRVDVLGSSDRGLRLHLPVVTLTLHYREGDRAERLSLQILPDVLAELRALCDRVLSR